MKWRGLAYFVLLFWFLALSSIHASGRQPAAADLERGPVELRLEVLVKILETDLGQRGAETRNAVQRELIRMLAHFRGPVPGSHDERDLNTAYAAGLVRALGEWRDPTTIELLIEYAGFVSFAGDALETFGEVAVPRLIETIEGSRSDLRQRNGATAVLGRLLISSGNTSYPLSNGSRERIVGLAGELMGKRFTFGNIVGTTTLALASGRADLRDELEKLATTQEAWITRGVVDTFQINFGQRIVMGKLREWAGRQR